MKILTVVDKPTSAIDRLAQMVKKYSTEDITVMPIHPKRESEENLVRFKELADKADIIDFQYWKTATMLLNRYPELKDKPTILAHHNPYNILEDDWNKYNFNEIIANNETLLKGLIEGGYPAKFIKLCVDFDAFDYNEERDYDKTDVLMVAARIEGKKGIKEVAQACKDLGYKFHLVGSVSDANYFHEVLQVGAQFYEKITDAELRELYNKCAVHVCNSVDNFESGTMPILESMACGLPVLTRNIGHVPDINNGKNMVVRFGAHDDMDELKGELMALVKDKKRRQELSEEGYRSAVYYSAELRARSYTKLYREVLYPNHKTVSVIIPTVPERKENLAKIAKAYENQTYPNIELVPIMDNAEGYNLAASRNIGAIKAIGEILVFNDDRFVPDKGAVENFIIKLAPKKWLFGNKDNANKKSFVENFSCIYRREFIDNGMCCERITGYGGMSQELRERFGRLEIEFEFVPEAKAKSLHRTKGRAGRLRSIGKMKKLLREMYDIHD